jgi:hypothetical protein
LGDGVSKSKLNFPKNKTKNRWGREPLFFGTACFYFADEWDPFNGVKQWTFNSMSGSETKEQESTKYPPAACTCMLKSKPSAGASSLKKA